jgi:hypothetical protein
MRRGPQSLDRTGHGRLKDLSHKSLIAALRMRRDNTFKRAYQQTPVGPSLGGNYSVVVIEHEHILRVLSRVPTLEETARIPPVF